MENLTAYYVIFSEKVGTDCTVEFVTEDRQLAIDYCDGMNKLDQSKLGFSYRKHGYNKYTHQTLNQVYDYLETIGLEFERRGTINEYHFRSKLTLYLYDNKTSKFAPRLHNTELLSSIASVGYDYIIVLPTHVEVECSYRAQLHNDILYLVYRLREEANLIQNLALSQTDLQHYVYNYINDLTNYKHKDILNLEEF